MIKGFDQPELLRSIFSCSNFSLDSRDYAERKNTPYYHHHHQELIESVKFVLKHFEEPLFPRTISTYRTKGSQIKVDSIDQVIKEFKKSGLIDCRINAFPAIDKPFPNFIFIDIDRTREIQNSSLDEKLETTLCNIQKKLGGFPTVIWTGNGYHIYQPLDTQQTRFEDISDFNFESSPDNRFLRFAKDFLSLGYADKQNNPSLKSCLLRVPGTYNSKYKSELEYSKVQIVKEWNKSRPCILDLTGSFYSYLISNYLKQLQKEKRWINNYRGKPISINWIERLLKTSVKDHRKYCIWRILLPYLINVRRYSETEACVIIEKWLEGCNQKRKLDFDPIYLIKTNLKNVNNYRPISLVNLKRENSTLYRLVKCNCGKYHDMALIS